MSILGSIVDAVLPGVRDAYNQYQVQQTNSHFGPNAALWNPTGNVSGVGQSITNMNNAVARTTSAINSGPQGGYSGPSGNNPYGETSATLAADPYAKYGGYAAYQNLVNNFASQKGNIGTTALEAAQNQGLTLKNNILDLVDSLKVGQQGIDNQAINALLAKMQGTQGVMGMVGRGIKSGGVMLANKNATDSSAAQAIANAYGDLGRRELSSVGNQFGVAQRGVEQAQANLDMQRNSGVRKIQDSKQQFINGIVSDARNKLAQLDADMANASLPDRINIEQEKEGIKNQVINTLQQYDQMLNEQTSGVQAMNDQQRQSQAYQLMNQGQAPENAFQYSTEAPAVMAGGPSASNLPLFTFARRRQG